MGIFKKVKKAVKKVAKVATKAAPALALIPGVGTAAAAAIGGTAGLLSGGGVSAALKGAAGGALGGLAKSAIQGAGGIGGLLGSGGSIAEKIKNMGLGGAIDLAGNVLGGMSALSQAKNAGAIREEANPFGQYREQYGDQLMRLASDPSAFANDPAYKFIMDQSLEASTRKMASQGYGGSGNMAIELADRAAGVAATYRGQEMDRLAGLAGANIMPASRASATAAQDSSFDQLSAILASLGYGMNRSSGGGEPLEEIVPAGQRIGTSAYGVVG